MYIILEVFIVTWEFAKALGIAFFRFFVSPPEKSVKGERILITGAGSGLGRLMCQRFAKRGAVIVACDINPSGNEETAKLVKSEGGVIYTYTCDVSDRVKIQELAEQVQRDVGHVTILINNAGIVSGKPFLETDDNLIQKTIDINLMAHMWTTKCFMPHMMEANHGHIVNIASMAGVVGTNSLTDYCASKFGDVGFTECLELEIIAAGRPGVHTSTVCPYFIDTGMFSGCKTRFPGLLPVLDPVETADTIVHAVLTNQKVLYVPRIMYLMAAIKSICPVDASLILHKFFGATGFMDSFIGRNPNKQD